MADRTATILKELGFRYDPVNIYHQVITLVLHTAEQLDLPRHLQLILAQPKNELIVHFPVRMDDGSYHLFKGYRVQHNNILGPYKGGIRYHPGVSLDHIKALAALMTMKTALFRLPLGGGKGGVQVAPRDISQDELMRMTRRFTSALGPNIGPSYDIPAPDVGTNAQVMAWIADTYLNLADPTGRVLGRAVVTGKPLSFGGSFGREKATAQGLVFVLEELLPEMDLNFEHLTYSLIGYGNVGSWTGKLLAQRGAELIAVMDHTGAIRVDASSGGLDAVKLARHVEKTGGIAGFKNADAIDEHTFYQTEVDLLVPAALEQMIDVKQAKLINCKVVAEGANAPTTPAGERVLAERGIRILPAILCNAGGVTVSYFEWTQNRQAQQWEEEVVDRELKRYTYNAAQRVRLAAHRYDCDLRTAAYIAALDHLGRVYKIRGIFP